MRGDWNARAREDAHYYVAFGRKQQTDEEFFATAAEQVRGLEAELLRLGAPLQVALEIGCGPGRLMRPLARHFAEIHGVDVSDEMIARACRNLAATPNAHLHHVPDSNLGVLTGRQFDFIYSYAVFQHIPSREVVLGYLRQAGELLRPGGLMRVQLNGLPITGESYTTWSGVRLSRAEVTSFAREQGLHLLCLEGAGTQYMWVTLRKPMVTAAHAGAFRIRRATNAYSGEPVAPVAGSRAALSLWIDGLSDEEDLNEFHVAVDGVPCFPTYLGPPAHDQLRQMNVLLPQGLATGIGRLSVSRGEQTATGTIRLIPAPPQVLKLVSLTDGVDLLSGEHVTSGLIKATLEELADPAAMVIRVNGVEAIAPQSFRIDPLLNKWEINFGVPPQVSGDATVEFYRGKRLAAGGRVQITAADR